MTVQHIPARSQIEAFSRENLRGKVRDLVVREGHADAAHERRRNVVQHRRKHGQGRQQHHVDHGDDGREGRHLARARPPSSARSRRLRNPPGFPSRLSTWSKIPVRSRTVHSTIAATTVTMPRATESRKAIFRTDQGSTLLTSSRARRTLALGAGLIRPGGALAAAGRPLSGRRGADPVQRAAGPGPAGRWPCPGSCAAARRGAAADAPGALTRGAAAGCRIPPGRRCSAWDMSRNYSLVTSGVVFVQLGIA